MKWYLAGAIGFTKGKQHETWRDGITKFLEQRGHVVFNPLKKHWPSSMGDARNYFKKLREQERIEETRGMFRRYIIPSDLAMVDQSDVILAYIQKGIPVCGTYGEITYAYAHGKAVFVVTNLLSPLLPNWLVGCSTFIFHSFKDFRRFMGERS